MKRWMVTHHGHENDREADNKYNYERTIKLIYASFSFAGLQELRRPPKKGKVFGSFYLRDVINLFGDHPPPATPSLWKLR